MDKDDVMKAEILLLLRAGIPLENTKSEKTRQNAHGEIQQPLETETSHTKQ